MKRPNIKRMQKHSAKCTPDQVSKRFELTAEKARYVEHPSDIPGVIELQTHFEIRMKRKHGIFAKIKTTLHSYQNMTGGVDYLLILDYDGQAEPFNYWDYLQTIMGRPLRTAEEIKEEAFEKTADAITKEANDRAARIAWMGN